MEVILFNILVGLAVSLIGSLISNAFAPKPEASKSAGTAVQTGGDVPLSFLVGTVATKGKLDYINSYGTSGDTPNANLVQLFSLGSIPIAGVTGFFENGQALTKNTSASDARGYGIPERKNGSAYRAWWSFRDGSDTTADSFMTTNFGSDANYPWASDMIGRGLPVMRMVALIDPKVWAGGYPDWTFVCQGIKLYNPTKDSTVGGSGSHRLATPSTWEFSDNPAVIIYNILLGIYYGSTWIWGGRILRDSSGAISAGAVAQRLPYASWSTAITACDASVTLNAGGSEARFRVGREIFTTEQPLDVINELLACCNARMTEVAGVYSIAVGDPGSAAATFTDADIVITDSQSLEPFPALDDVINGATATYREPGQAWTEKSIAYRNATYKTADDGREQLVDLDLKAVFSGTQAQRILQAQVKDARKFARHVVTLTPKWGTYRALDVIAWTSTRNGYSAKAFLIVGCTILANGNALMALQEIDPTDHSWTPATDEKTYTAAPLVPILPAAIPMTGWTAAAGTYTDSGSVDRRLCLNVQFAGTLANVRAVRIQVRAGWGSKTTIFDTGEQFYDRADADPVTRRISWPGILASSTYEVRGQFIASDPRQDGTWSSWISVTTADVRTTLPDLATEVSAQISDMAASIRSLIADAQALAAVTAGSMLADYSDRQMIRTELVSTKNDVTARYTEAIIAATGPGSALVARVTSLESTVNNPSTGVSATATALSALTTRVTTTESGITTNASAITALQSQMGNTGSSAVFAIQTGYTPAAGWTSKIGIVAAVSAGGTMYAAGLYFEAKTGSSRIVAAASQFVFATSAGNPIALIDGTTGVFGDSAGKVALNMYTGAFSITV